MIAVKLVKKGVQGRGIGRQTGDKGCIRLTTFS